MVLTLGTNCGFVTTAPTADPAEGVTTQKADRSHAIKVVTPNENITITQIGWWASDAQAEANFEVGIYNHNSGDDEPEDMIGTPNILNAKGTDSGWKTAEVDISLSPNTTYWIAVQLDDHGGGKTQIDVDGSSGNRFATKTSSTSLTDPWATSAGFSGTLIAIYGLYSEAETTRGLTGSRGTKEILTRYPVTQGLEEGERHEGIKIGLTPKISNVGDNQKVGLF